VLFTVANGQLVRAEIAENLDLHLWERYFVRDKFIENGRIRTDMLSSLSIDGSELVAVSEDHPHVRSWDLSTGKPVRSFNAESVIEESKSKNSQINYSPNGKLFSVLSRDEKKIVFAIHSTVSSESLFEISFPHETERLHADVFLSNDGRATIATSTELRTWDAFNKIEISRIALNERLIPIGISQEHSMFAGVHYPRWYWIPCSIDIIDINLGKSIRKISLPRAIFGSDRIKLFDNQRLGLIDQDGLRVWTLK
jgi:WD40 repeat protein